MRAQAYTLFNMLIWTVFAAAFLLAAYAAYNYLVPRAPSMTQRRLEDVLSSAWEARDVEMKKPVIAYDVAFPSGFILTEEWVKNVVGDYSIDVEFVVGPGFQRMDGGIRVPQYTKARIVGACCSKYRCILWLNRNPDPMCPTAR